MKQESGKIKRNTSIILLLIFFSIMVLSTGLVSATEENGTTNTTNTIQNLTEDVTTNTTTNNYPTSYAAAGSPTFTQAEIIQANLWVKNYIEANQELPDFVTINGIDVNMPSFLRLITTLTQKIHAGDNSPIEYILCNDPTAPQDNVKPGTITQSTYLDIAGRVQRYMDHNLKAPNYSSYSNLGSYFSYQNMIYTFSKILDTYNTNGALPANAEIKLWKAIIDPDGSWCKPVYITCDNIYTESTDWAMMNAIVAYLSNWGSDWGLYADAWGRGPNTHCEVISNSSVPENALVVDIYGGACAATIYEMGLNYYKAWKGIAEVFTIWIKPPSWDIRNCPTRDIYGRNFLPKAWDDNFSDDTLPNWGYNTKGQLVKGLSNPDQYMAKHGYQFMVTSYDTLNMAIGIYEQLVL